MSTSSMTCLVRRLTFARSSTLSRPLYRPIAHPTQTCQCRRTILDDADISSLNKSSERLKRSSRQAKPPTPKKVPRQSIFNRAAFRAGYEKNPTAVKGAFIILGLITSYISYHALRYILEIYIPLNRFPPLISQPLRRALYYEVRHAYLEALPHYQRALEVAQGLDLDVLSDEMTGLRIAYAATLQKAGKLEDAIEMLEGLKTECLDELTLRKRDIEPKDRWRVMKRLVGASNRIGILYAGLKDGPKAEEALSWAVTTVLKESRAEREGEKNWKDEEIGATLEQLAEFYEKANRFDYALPLFLEAITYIQPANCHSVILMNNIATSLSQSPLPKGQAMSRAQQIQQAQAWAQKALDVAASLIPAEREGNEECQAGCVVAQHNLGEMEEMLGNKETAEKLYLKALEMAELVHFEIGIDQAKGALLRLKGGEKENGKTRGSVSK